MQQYQDQHRPPTPREPVIEFKVQTMLAFFAIVIAVVSVIMSFTVIGPALAYVGIVIGLAALGYITFVLIIEHQERRERARIERRRQEALAEREEIINQQERAKAISLIQPGPAGNYPIWIDAYGQPHTFQPGNVIQPVPQHYSPTHHIDYRVAGKEIAAAPEVPAIAGPLPLPGPISMIEVMKHFHLSLDHLFLALGRGGQQLACSIDEFMHVAHDGPTGSGKTMQWKAEIVMLLKAEILTFLANPHFAPVTKKGEDWRPIGRALETQELPGQLPGLLYTFEQIRDFLRWLSQVEIDRRFEHQRAGWYDYLPLYGFVDEWAAQVAKYPECGAYMQDIIRRGRAVDVCISTNSQGFLVNDIGMSGASRENFQTAYHLGGSIQSASALLDMRQQDITRLLTTEQVALGKGIGLLRNNSVSDPAQLVRLPLADNDYVYYMLGRADQWSLPDYRIVSEVDNKDEKELPAIETHTTTWHEQGTGILETNLVSRNEMPLSLQQKAANVSPETKRHIQRLIDKTNMPWSEIAEAVGMASEKYSTFKVVVAEMGYDTSVRRSGRKGGQ